MKGQLSTILVLSILFRLIPIIYLSQFQNISQQQLKLTDIDYKVYTDASFSSSPYDRHTYRYTPFLAYFMKFNHSMDWIGKAFFVLFDAISILGLWKLMKVQYRSAVAKLYGYNPLFIYLTVRGSCESINMCLMYWCFYFIFKQNGNSGLSNKLNKYLQIQSLPSHTLLFGYLLYGLWVHFRIYPIIFLPVLIAHQYHLCKKTSSSFLLAFMQLAFISGGTFLALLGIFYSLYGNKFIQQSYLYHLSRMDNRHSFSAFFYEIYLSTNTQTIMKSFVRSLPQIYVIFIATKKLHIQISPFYAVFIITYAFVNFNKVITMQYYMWLWGALFILLPESSLATNSNRRWRIAFNLSIQWVLGIMVWVWLSFRLQKDGENVFNFMWIICVIKLFWDLWVVSGFLKTIKNIHGYEKIKAE